MTVADLLTTADMRGVDLTNTDMRGAKPHPAPGALLILLITDRLHWLVA